MKRTFRRIVAMLLVLTLLVNINSLGLQAYAAAEVRNTEVISAQESNLNTDVDLSASSDVNILPNVTEKAKPMTRSPDIGNEVDESFNL